MPINVQITKSTGGGKFKAMPTGLHQARIAEVKYLGKRAFSADEEAKDNYVARFVNTAGEEASRFYTPSLHEKSKLAIDLLALDGAVPDTFNLGSLEGRQVQVLVQMGKNKKGYDSAKVISVAAPAPGQNVQ